MTAKRYFFILMTTLFCLATQAQIEPLIYYKATHEPGCQHWVDSVFNTMTLQEKVGQLFIYTIAPENTKPNLALLRNVVSEQHVGGLLFSKGVPETQATVTNQAQDMAKVPLMITFDGEWGLSMRLKNTPVYPRNMTLGNIEDEQLIYEYGREVARQCREMGIHVNFAPVADVNINPKNPVINTRSFGNDPKSVSDMVILYSCGLESGGVLSVAKHFPGHGDTETDSHHALPTLNFTRERLDSIELYPFKQYIRAGLGGVMVGHLEVPALEPQQGLPSSLSKNIVQHLLREELQFNGLIFTDALVMKGAASSKHPSLDAIKAGNDMVLTPRNVKEEIEAVMRAIADGELSEEVIDQKCRKILAYKYALGVAHQQKIQLAGLSQRINTPEAQALAKRLNDASTAGAHKKAATLNPDEEDPTVVNTSFGNMQKRIDAIAREGIDAGAYPGCQIAVMKDGKLVYSKAFGTFTGKGSPTVTTTSIYDIASLSKTSGTLLAIMKLYDQGKLKLTDNVSKYLPFMREPDKKNITIRQLLLHETGLPSSIFFYQLAINEESYEGNLFKAKRTHPHTVQVGAQRFAQPNFAFIDGLTSNNENDIYTTRISDDLWLNRAFNDTITARIGRTKINRSTYLYSDVGFIILQKLVENLTGMPLDQYLNQEFYAPMGLKRTAYQPLKYFKKEDIVPSTKDPFLRKTTVQGFVHDEAAAFQGGVSGNAGIFSTAEEIALIHQMILNGGELNGKRYLSKETCKLFTTEKSKTSRRGLGFDKPDKKNPAKSPCTPIAPAAVYGHNGFTGTCAWVEPTTKTVYVFLSNRTYPDVWVNKLQKMNIRERIQEVIYESGK